MHFLEPTTQLLYKYDREVECGSHKQKTNQEITQAIEDARLRMIGGQVIAHSLFYHEEPKEDASYIFNDLSSFNLMRKQEYSLTSDLKELNFIIKRAIPKLTIGYTIIMGVTCFIAFLIAKCYLRAGWLASLSAISTWMKTLNDLHKLKKEKEKREKYKKDQERAEQEVIELKGAHENIIDAFREITTDQLSSMESIMKRMDIVEAHISQIIEKRLAHTGTYNVQEGRMIQSVLSLDWKATHSGVATTV